MDYSMMRTEVIPVRVSPKEKAILKREAEREGVPVSDLLRFLGLWAALKRGDSEAWHYIRWKMSLEMQEYWRGFCDDLKLPKLSGWGSEGETTR
jgi:mobilization protein NikA